MMRWLRGSTAAGTPGAEEGIGKENVMPMVSDNLHAEGAEDEVETSKKPLRNTPRRAAAKSKKSAPAKASPAKAATPLRRSTRAQSRKSGGFFDAAQEATPDPMSIASIIDAPPTSTSTPPPPSPQQWFSVAQEESLLRQMENLHKSVVELRKMGEPQHVIAHTQEDESHVSVGEMEVPQQVISHAHSDETAAGGENREPAVEMTESLRSTVAPGQTVAVQETAAVQETTVAQEIAVAQETAAVQETATSQAAQDSHAIYSATPAFDHASQNSTLPADNPTISSAGICYVPASIRPGHSSSVPTDTEPNITFIPTQSASEGLPSQTETAQTSIPAPSTSNQSNESFTNHRAVRPGGLSTSKYAVVPAAPIEPTDPPMPFSAYANSGKRRHVEEENEGPSGFQHERSAKRVRTTHSRESAGDRSTALPQILPSPYDRYEWALINDNMRDSQDQSMNSEPEETPERSVVGQDIIDREPVIKTEPTDDAPSNLAVIPPAHHTLLTPAQSNSPSMGRTTAGPTATQLTDPQTPVSTPEYIDLFRLCIPHSSVRQPTLTEANLLREIERKAAIILSGGQAKVNIISQLPAWMREGMCKTQRRRVAAIQRRIEAAKSGPRLIADVRSFNNRAVVSTPAPMRAAPAPVTQHYQQAPPMTASAAPPQVQPSAPQQARQPYGLDPLQYEKFFGPALVYSALEQVNNMLGALGVNVRCFLSGMDTITLKKNHEIVLPPAPPGCMPLSLENMPYAKLAGPALVNHALHQVNEMMSSLWPGQFVLHGKDMLLLQS
ncbi:uncharacterized protein J4E88_002194 [Alternaria novae-zelandiae]|uniref:uncharacterized protein n=1 Tax=Alternaria novae-zelandiae TaxID=430562 RepID=UPI0020C4F55D|nr:uncharacterized protein J4E88_002194 [Alternaria novae-zelandiae]KAI4690722.1 hypothetical protein J4E88_002194 [Alternaria novae-zelandiae]